jgi:hypothetical protein
MPLMSEAELASDAAELRRACFEGSGERSHQRQFCSVVILWGCRLDLGSHCHIGHIVGSHCDHTIAENNVTSEWRE